VLEADHVERPVPDLQVAVLDQLGKRAGEHSPIASRGASPKGDQLGGRASIEAPERAIVSGELQDVCGEHARLK
jgi:hypothetical protein